MLQAYQKLYGSCILVVGFVCLATAACSSGASGGGATGSSGSTTGASGSTTGTSGGATGASGSAGDAGETVDAADAGSPTANCLWTFDDPDAGLQGWTFNPYQTTTDPFVDADGIDPSNLSEQANIICDNAGGNPSPPNGEMTITVPFSAYTPPYGQKADIHNVMIPPAGMDLSQSTITMQVKLDGNADGGVPFSPSPSAPGGLVMYIKTGNFVYAQNTYTNIVSTDHNWVEYSFNVPFGVNIASSPNYLDGGFNAMDVIEIGFTLNTGSGGTPLADGAPPATAPPTAATFHIDSICLQPAQ